MSLKDNHLWAILTEFSPCIYEFDETKHIPTKKSRINSFVVKSALQPRCKRFSKSALRDNFNPKPDPQIKRTHSWKRHNYAHQYYELKEKLYTNSLTFVWTIFEHQFKDMYVCQKKVQVFFSFFPVFTGQKYFPGTFSATNKQVH